MVDIGRYGFKINNATSLSGKLTRQELDLPAPVKLPGDKDGYAVTFVFAVDKAFH